MASSASKNERRYEDAVAASEASGMKSCLKIPEGLPIWKPKAGVYKVDFVGYVLGKKVKKFSRFANKIDLTPGRIFYRRAYFVWRNVGVNQETLVSPGKTFDLPDPISEHAQKLWQDPKTKEQAKGIYPSQREMFLVYVHEESEKGLQLWDVSYHAFGKQLDQKINMAEESRKARYKQFYREDEKGYTLRLICVDAPMGEGKGTFPSFSVDEFIPRKKALNPKFVNHGFCLEDFVVVLEYDEIKKKWFGLTDDEIQDEDGENEDEPEENDEDTEDSEEDEVEEPDDEEGESEEDEESDSDDEESDLEKGDAVTFKYKKKIRTGTIKKINRVKGIAGIEVDYQEDLAWVNLDELTKADDEEEEEEEPEEDEENEESEEEESEDEENDEEEEEEEEEPEEEEEEDEDESFEEEEEEEEKPRRTKPKTGKKKPKK